MAAFEILNKLNVNGHTETKNVGGKDLTYLSWVWAWAEVKKAFPDAHYVIWKNENGLPYICDPNTGYMVYTSVTIEGITHEMWLPVMDGANKAMKSTEYEYSVKNPKFKYAKWNAERKAYIDGYGNEQEEYITKHVEAATMMDVNKAIMRCLVKNLAMFGLGLYIYAGEDLPESERQENEQGQTESQKQNEFTRPVNSKEEVNATVQKVDKVPAAEPENPVKKYIANEISFMKQIFGIPETKEMSEKFMAMRASLIKGKVIPDVDSDHQTMEQAKNMIEAMYKNFKPSGERSA